MNNVLGIIPARGGSKGLPGKNIKELGGLPLIAHSIAFAQLCSEITDCIISTDSEEIAEVARQYGGNVPFMRPTDLAQDDTPMLPVLLHGLKKMEQLNGVTYDYLLLLQPTTPFRLPQDITGALKKLRETPNADGIVSVTEPEFNPLWVCVTEKDGYMVDLFEQSSNVGRRQELPTVYRLNGLLYIWKREFILSNPYNLKKGRNLLYFVEQARSVDIDTVEDFEKAVQLIQQKTVHLPWIKDT